MDQKQRAEQERASKETETKEKEVIVKKQKVESFKEFNQKKLDKYGTEWKEQKEKNELKLKQERE